MNLGGMQLVKNNRSIFALSPPCETVAKFGGELYTPDAINYRNTFQLSE